MTLYKNEIPILEYDDEKMAVIMPTDEEYNVKLPTKCVFAFLGEETIEDFAKEHGAEKVTEFESVTKIYNVYQMTYQGHEVCFMHAPMGSVAAVQIMDWLIALGVREIMSAGSCGCLVDIPENTFIVPFKALRDEGASFHYLPPTRYVEVNRKALKAIERTLIDHGLNYTEVVTWTTDGFFRETRDIVKYRVEEGCSVVEMECSGLASCAEFREVIWGQILFTADSLADIEKHDKRNWGGDSFEYSLKLCLDAVVNIES